MGFGQWTRTALEILIKKRPETKSWGWKGNNFMEYRNKKFICEDWQTFLEETGTEGVRREGAEAEGVGREGAEAEGVGREGTGTEGFLADPAKILENRQEMEWKQVCLPHNWDNYHGYRRLSHGNLHGTAWYYKNLEDCLPQKGSEKEKAGNLDANAAGLEGRHIFVEFEGAGSYLSLWCGGRYIGGHKGGRTCYTAEITDALKENPSEEKFLLVRTEHPEKIKDLPWVCGGCWGTPNTEGSQPFGIFRPVSVYETGKVRVAPFGVAVHSERMDDGCVRLVIQTELQNLEEREVQVQVSHTVTGPDGQVCAQTDDSQSLAPDGHLVETQEVVLKDYVLWDLENPALYRVSTSVEEQGAALDSVENSFGIRFLEWENFGDGDGEVLDEGLLTAVPQPDNNYFTETVKCSGHAKVKVSPCGIRIKLPRYAPEDTVIEIETVIKNTDTVPHEAELESFVQTYNRTKSIADLKTRVRLLPGETKSVVQRTDSLQFLDAWSAKRPYYHQVATTLRDLAEELTEPVQVKTPFAVYEEKGLVNRAYPYRKQEGAEQRAHRFLLNGRPILINGTCEYEHLMGNDHAFEKEQIEARMHQIQATGFNAFREAHCPHNLRYLEYCEQNGILYWAQMGAHLYFDTEEFRENFRILTKEWVKERRNSPSVILWGIQNESMLPESFASELTGLIRELDPTTSKQRKTTTCNGGTGSDWNIPQNWSGTYGGSVTDYGRDILDQRLVGEYGQYRVLGKHEEGDMHERQNTGGDVSEELFCYCLETKVREIEKQKDLVSGHFQWIFNAHANPGRETLYCLDGSGSNAIGVVNSKGLLTSWGEPVDAWYMYRSHYVSCQKEPMVYLVSHTWPDRFKDGPHTCDITVYSNCDEVELYNGYRSGLLGRNKRREKGEPFVFSGVRVEYGMLCAVGYVDGRMAAEDVILLEGLPHAADTEKLYEGAVNFTASPEEKCLYRVNCGGSAYTDVNHNLWSEDRKWQKEGYGWTSWGMGFENVEDEIGSEGRIYDPIRNSLDQELFQSYRYGREKLEYHFEAEPGTYRIELYFTEPWYGIGGGMDCEGWRVFDAEVNGRTVLKDLDIWKESGTCNGLKKTIVVENTEHEIRLSFPRVKSYQAVICAIAVCQI